MDFATYRLDHRATDFFEKYVQSFVPPWYSLIALELTGATGKDFRHPWSWAFDQLMNETSTPYTLGVVPSYCADQRGDSLPGATSRVSEVYKSSFVRTIQWFAEQGWLDRRRATEYALSICPVDFSLWSIAAAAIPSWWPRSAEDAARTDLTSLSGYAECEHLINIRDNGDLLFGAEGAMIPHVERTMISSSFQLLPFAYKVQGPSLPDAKVVAAFLRQNFWQKDPTSPEPLSIFVSSFDGWIPHKSKLVRINDLVVVPLLSRIESININIWNSCRGAHRPFFPAPTLIAGGAPGCDSESWFYQVDGDRVCRMRD